MYLLLGRPLAAPSKVDENILAYIKGKVTLSALIGLTTWLTLLAIGLDLCLVFGVLAFCARPSSAPAHISSPLAP